MTDKQFYYIYGPVYSWRLGMSLGIDSIATEQKLCNFNCVYCQLGDTFIQTSERKVFVPTQKIIDEIRQLDPQLAIDYITFSGCGEPTLAKNLGEMIAALKACRCEKIAVITNAGLIGQEEVRKDLLLADCVLVKLDACDQASLEAVDRPDISARFDEIVEGLKMFAKDFQGKLALQLMFVEVNKANAQALAEIAATIGADEIELNTPLRPCGVSPLSPEEMTEIKTYFENLPGVTMVYDRKRGETDAMDEEATVKRHGEYRQDR